MCNLEKWHQAEPEISYIEEMDFHSVNVRSCTSMQIVENHTIHKRVLVILVYQIFSSPRHLYFDYLYAICSILKTFMELRRPNKQYTKIFTEN